MLGMNLLEQSLDFRIGFVLCRFILQDQIGAHAASGKILHTVDIFTAVGVGIEMARAGIAHIFQKFHQKKRLLVIMRSETKILIIAGKILIVQVDVEQLAGIPGLRDIVQEIQPGHVLVCHFRIDANHVRMIERFDEGQHVPGGRQENVTARFVWLGFQRKLFGGWLARWKYALLAGLGLFAVLSFVEYFWVDQAIGERWLGPSFIGIFRTLYAVTFSFVLLAFDKVKLPLEKQISQLGLISLGIYLVNTPAIYLTSSLLYKFAPWVLGRQIVYQPILTAAGLFIPVLLIQVFKWGPLKRYSPTVFG